MSKNKTRHNPNANKRCDNCGKVISSNKWSRHKKRCDFRNVLKR